MDKDRDHLNEIEKNEEIDYISKLPEKLISLILSFLTVRDAAMVRMSSSSWRNIVAFAPDVQFDLLTVLGIGVNKWDDDNTIIMSPAEFWEDKRNRFIRAVDQYLQLCRRRQKLNSLKISFEFGQESADHIDRWISFAVETKVEKLTLNFMFFSKGSNSRERYNFSFHNQSSGLKHLRLRGCKLRPYSPGYLNRWVDSLKILDLYYVPLDESAFNSISFSCRNLEQLKLIGCSLPRVFMISSSGGGGGFHHLKRLNVDDCGQLEEFEVSYINLTTFEFAAKISHLSLVGIDSLEKVHIGFYGPSRPDYIFNGLAKDAPLLQTLSISMPAGPIWPLPAEINLFSHLKELVVCCFPSWICDLVSLTFFLDACPCLHRLRVILDRICGLNGEIAERDYPMNLHYQLKEVEIDCYRDSFNLFEFAIHLLKCAVGLERVIFNSRWSHYAGDFKWTYEDTAPSHCEESQKQFKDRFLSEAEDIVRPGTELIFL